MGYESLMNEAIAKRIRERLSEIGLSPRSASLKAGLSDSFIRNILDGKSKAPKWENIAKLAPVLHVSEDWLRTGKGEPSDPIYSDDDPSAPDPIDPDARSTWDANEGPRGIPVDASAQIDVTAGMGGGGVTIVAEGIPGKSGMTFSNDVISDYWRLPSALVGALNLRARDIAVIGVQGNSMSPTLEEGDFVFIDTRHRWPSPDGLYALADEFGGIIVKRLELSSRPGSQEKTVRIISDNPKHEPKEWGLDEIQIIGRVMRRFSAV